MSAPGASIGDLPHALERGDDVARRLARREPAVSLDYDGTSPDEVERFLDALARRVGVSSG